MALARYESVAVNLAGDVIPNATVEVRRDQPGRPVVPLWADREGTIALGNPITTDAEGKFGFHVTGGSYYIRVFTGPSQQPLQQYVRRYQAIGTAGERDVEDLASALEAGTATFPTIALLQAFTPAEDEGIGGKVTTGEEAGFYHYNPALAPGSRWVFDRPLYDSLARMNVIGGDENDIEAEIASGVSDASVVMLWIEAPETNTGPVTINAKPVLNSNDDELSAGQWVEGRTYWFSDEGAFYKLRTDSDVSDLVAQVEALAEQVAEDKDAAETASAAAIAAAAGVNLPAIVPGDAGKQLFVKDDETGYKLDDAARGGGEMFSTVALLLADNGVIIGYAASGAEVEVEAGDVIVAQGYRYEVAASGASNHNVITAGGVKLYVQPGPDGAYSVWAFGASAVTDSTAIVQAAIDVASASPGYKTPVTLGGLSVYVTGEIFLKSNMILRDGTINWVPSANGMVCVNFGTKTGAYLVRVTGAENVVVDASTSTKDNIMGFNFGHLARSCFSSHCRAVMNNGAPSVSRNHIGFAISGILSVFETTGNRTNGSPVITAIPATGLMAAGMAINGTGIPGGATILSVDSATQITLSANATSTGAGGFLDVQRAAGAGAYQNAITDASAYYCGTSYYLETDGYGTSGWQAEMNANIVQGTCFSAVNKSLIVGYGARENNIQIRADNFVSQLGQGTTIVVADILGAYNHIRVEEEIGPRADTQYTIRLQGNICLYNTVEYTTQGIMTAAVVDATTSPCAGKNIVRDIGTAQALKGGDVITVSSYKSGPAGAITSVDSFIAPRRCILTDVRAFNWRKPATLTYLHFAKNGTRDTVQRLGWTNADAVKTRKSLIPDASAFVAIDSRFIYAAGDFVEISIEQDATLANEVSYTLTFKVIE